MALNGPFKLSRRGLFGLLLSLLSYVWRLAPTEASAIAEYPANIRLQVGVLPLVPWIYVVEDPETGKVVYQGFMMELMEHLSSFAARDNVTLEFNVTAVPGTHDDIMELVSNTCLETKSPEECGQFDLIAGDYYATPERSLKADLSPAWLRSSVALIRQKPELLNPMEHGEIPDNMYAQTMDQATRQQAPVCVVKGTYVSRRVRAEYPTANFVDCAAHGEGVSCYTATSNGNCTFIAADEMAMRALALRDPTLEVLRESFLTQVS